MTKMMLYKLGFMFYTLLQIFFFQSNEEKHKSEIRQEYKVILNRTLLLRSTYGVTIILGLNLFVILELISKLLLLQVGVGWIFFASGVISIPITGFLFDRNHYYQEVFVPQQLKLDSDERFRNNMSSFLLFFTAPFAYVLYHIIW